MTRLLALSLALAASAAPALARADATTGVGATLTRLEADLERAAPDDPARRFAGHTLTEARRVLAEAKELARLGRVDDARARLRLVELRVRLVSVAVDAARLEAMARERETTALRLREEARVARAAFEQAFERRVELEHAPSAGAPASSPPAATGRPATPPDGEE
jgi:peptidoglycan DL-endopeptidase CwlO